MGAYVYSGAACTLGAGVCLGLLLLPLPATKREKIARRHIHHLCLGLVRYLQFFQLLEADFSSLATLRERGGVIIAVNHPTYIDAILLMSQLPQVFCLMKAGLYANPIIAAMVRGAGYEDNSDSAQLIEHCARRLKNGETLLVFPEGTRTSTPPLGRFKRGFAVMAQCAKIPVVTVNISAQNGVYLRKGEPFFAFPPQLPVRYAFTLGEEFSIAPEESSRDFCERIESRFRTALSAPSHQS